MSSLIKIFYKPRNVFLNLKKDNRMLKHWVYFILISFILSFIVVLSWYINSQNRMLFSEGLKIDRMLFDSENSLFYFLEFLIVDTFGFMILASIVLLILGLINWVFKLKLSSKNGFKIIVYSLPALIPAFILTLIWRIIRYYSLALASKQILVITIDIITYIIYFYFLYLVWLGVKTLKEK